MDETSRLMDQEDDRPLDTIMHDLFYERWLTVNRKERLRSALKIHEHDAATAEQKGWSCYCDYCGRDLSRTVRMKCSECSDFDLCVDCFSVGVEIRGHKNNHAYQIQVRNPAETHDWFGD